MSHEPSIKQSSIKFSRIALYCIGILILACGITLNTKTKLGVSPVISVAYNVAQILHTPLGVTTFVYYAFLILLQFLLIPKEFSITQFAQIICAFLTSACIQVFDIILPSSNHMITRLVLLFVAIFLTGIGASITVSMKLVPNPADGLANTIGKKVGRDLGLGKNILDAICIILAILLGLVFSGSLLGIGIGTAVSVIFTGRVMALVQGFSSKLYEKIS
jgi:uncharacterized protein